MLIFVSRLWYAVSQLPVTWFSSLTSWRLRAKIMEDSPARSYNFGQLPYHFHLRNNWLWNSIRNHLECSLISVSITPQPPKIPSECSRLWRKVEVTQIVTISRNVISMIERNVTQAERVATDFRKVAVVLWKWAAEIDLQNKVLISKRVRDRILIKWIRRISNINLSGNWTTIYISDTRNRKFIAISKISENLWYCWKQIFGCQGNNRVKKIYTLASEQKHGWLWLIVWRNDAEGLRGISEKLKEAKRIGPTNWFAVNHSESSSE